MTVLPSCIWGKRMLGMPRPCVGSEADVHAAGDEQEAPRRAAKERGEGRASAGAIRGVTKGDAPLCVGRLTGGMECLVQGEGRSESCRTLLAAALPHKILLPSYFDSALLPTQPSREEEGCRTAGGEGSSTSNSPVISPLNVPVGVWLVQGALGVRLSRG